jgi:S-adenosylmethionine-diacylglycerol 3-amino-3-carboxypropyl transferase
MPDWVEVAAALPLAFAQVREDASIDCWAAGRGGAGARVLMVASGGCTAAALATQPVGLLHLVDPNPAQLALARLKLELLSHPRPLRMALLGHRPMSGPERMVKLDAVFNRLGLPLSMLGPVEYVSAVGPDHAGRYERVFEQLRNELAPQARALATLLTTGDTAAQSSLAAQGTRLGDAVNAAFENVFALPNLVHIFGETATRNPAESFAQHFIRRTRVALSNFSAMNNPFLWQMLAGNFPPDVAHTWLMAESPARMPELQFSNAVMNEVLAGYASEFDVVHLSNILDWLSEEEAVETLELAWTALRPGGCVVIRQLNSRLDIPVLGDCFKWLRDDARSWLKRDRSFFYRALFFGVRP